eukprot:scaffold754_cov248-Pinguiococcus_pyrenoidosus.AAC.24
MQEIPGLRGGKRTGGQCTAYPVATPQGPAAQAVLLQSEHLEMATQPRVGEGAIPAAKALAASKAKLYGSLGLVTVDQPFH